MSVTQTLAQSSLCQVLGLGDSDCVSDTSIPNLSVAGDSHRNNQQNEEASSGTALLPASLGLVPFCVSKSLRVSPCHQASQWAWVPPRRAVHGGDGVSSSSRSCAAGLWSPRRTSEGAETWRCQVTHSRTHRGTKQTQRPYLQARSRHRHGGLGREHPFLRDTEPCPVLCSLCQEGGGLRLSPRPPHWC